VDRQRVRRAAQSAVLATALRLRALAPVAVQLQQFPAIWDSAQFHDAAVHESRPGADNQVADGARYEDFARTGLAEDPRRNVHRDPADVGIHQFALAGVNADADLDAQFVGIVT
jgi:hypothetical protein